MLMLVVGLSWEISQTLASTIRKAYELLYVGNQNFCLLDTVQNSTKRTQLNELLQRGSKNSNLDLTKNSVAAVRIQPITIDEYKLFISDPNWIQFRPNILVVFHNMDSSDHSTMERKWMDGFVQKNDGDIIIQPLGCLVDESFYEASGIHFLRRISAINAIETINRCKCPNGKSDSIVKQLMEIYAFLDAQLFEIKERRNYG